MEFISRIDFFSTTSSKKKKKNCKTTSENISGRPAMVKLHEINTWKCHIQTQYWTLVGGGGGRRVGVGVGEGEGWREQEQNICKGLLRKSMKRINHCCHAVTVIYCKQTSVHWIPTHLYISTQIHAWLIVGMLSSFTNALHSFIYV